MSGWSQDLRFGLRRLGRRPAFAAGVVLTLALGIGANAAIFGLVEALLLRPLPFEEPDRLAMLWQTMPGNDRRWVAPANLVDWRGTGSFEGLAAFMTSERNLGGAERPTRVSTSSVSAGLFELLRTRPPLGRAFGNPGPSEAGLAVISHGLWQASFGGAPGCVGRRLLLDREVFTVTGWSGTPARC